MDIANYSADSRAVIKNAREVAAAFRHPEIELEHLLIATVRHEESEVGSILSQLDKNPGMIESVTELYLKDQSARQSARDNLTASPAVQETLKQALDEKNRLYDALVEPEHILIAIFDPKSALAPYVRDKVGIAKEDIYRAIAEAKSVSEITTAPTAEKPGAEGKPARKDVSGTLKYTTDMTNLAAAGEFDPVIGREDEVQQVIQILLRRRKNSPVLTGGAGVGKSAIIEGFAQRVIDGNVPKALAGIKVLEVDMGAMVAGAKYKGEFEERFKNLVGDVVKTAGQVVLFIDEIHTISGAGGGGGMDAANLLKPPLARGQIRLIGATTEEEYTKYLEKDKALDRRFERVKVEEPDVDDSIRIVKGVVAKYEEHHGLKYTPEAVVGAVKYAKRYLSERNLPDIALDLVDEAGSEFSVKEEFAKVAIPVIEESAGELEKMLAACEAKETVEDSEEYIKLKEAYEEYARKTDRLKDAWGHRSGMLMGAEQ